MSTPAFRLAIVASLIREMTAEGRDIGKIQLQKIVYFFQNCLNVPLDYRFVMHHYGPYSTQIEDDLSMLRSIELADVTVDPEGYGYHIKPGNRHVSDIPNWGESVLPHTSAIAHVKEAFEHYAAWRLELAATIHYVHSLRPDVSLSEVLHEVIRLKPKFSDGEVRRTYEDLVRLGFMAKLDPP